MVRILLTNDDGIHAQGFAVLEKIARAISDDVWVCAPESEQSATAHSLTIHRPLRLREIGDQRFALDGTPTDCVLLAINHLMQDSPPDLVLSGVNHGHNIAEDVTYSGTIAAAMEATLLGVKAIALSQAYIDGTPIAFCGAEKWGDRVVKDIQSFSEWPQKVLMNVNFPPCAGEEIQGITAVGLGHNKVGDDLVERFDPRGRAYYWIGSPRSIYGDQPDTDSHAMNQKLISVTPLHLDLTYYQALQGLGQIFRDNSRS